MTLEFPPPDARLADKVKIVRLEPKVRACNGNDRRGGEFSCDAVNEGQAEIDDDAEIGRLAKLKLVEYERERKDAAGRLNIRASILDRLVAAERGQSDDDGKQGRALTLPEPEPWHEPVHGSELLDALFAAICRHVVAPEWAVVSIVLWALHTYLLDCFGISPRLAITSPEKGCGKTTLLDVLSHLVMRVLLTANATTSAIFRVVEMQRPTLLFDEADTFLSENEGLRGILNSGHRQGGSVVRTSARILSRVRFQRTRHVPLHSSASCPLHSPIAPCRSNCGDAGPTNRSSCSDLTAPDISTSSPARPPGGHWTPQIACVARTLTCPMAWSTVPPTTGAHCLPSRMPPAASGLRALVGRCNVLRRQPATMTNPPASPCSRISAPSSASAAPTGCLPPS